ncbi:MAG: S41 family peptidase [Leptolyngbyaceae cyanobacterium MO_188.B28]|nr:S41 family peptidase [Leptolyngbyaceae cyanobacterium MO_188.B28]
MTKTLFQKTSTILVGTIIALLSFQQIPIQNPALAAPPSLQEPLFAGLTNSSRELIDQVWQLVERHYIDPSFNGQDWNAIRLQYLQQSYESDELLYNAIEEMLASLEDPLTRFMRPEEFRALQISGDPVGIGLSFIKDEQTNEVLIIKPTEDSPASEAGILPGDILVNIDGIDTLGMRLWKVVSLLRGEVGTVVTVKVRRGQREIDFRVIRRQVEIHPVKYMKQDSRIGAIGYIRLTQFSPNAAAEMRSAIQDLESQNVKGYILDLRSNSGGLLYSSLDIARMWLDHGKIVSAVGRDGIVDEEVFNNRALTDLPLVVLVDRGSANASEILAGALQSHQRALLVGTETAGANSLQSVRSLPDGSGIAITVAKWYPPDGQDIDSSGLIPDIRVDLTEEQQQTLFQNRSLVATSDDPQYVQALSALTSLIADSARY